MTRKHFEFIAKSIRDAKEHGLGTDRDETLELLAHYLTGYMAQENPRFDKTRFLKACGY